MQENSDWWNRSMAFAFSCSGLHTSCYVRAISLSKFKPRRLPHDRRYHTLPHCTASTDAWDCIQMLIDAFLRQFQFQIFVCSLSPTTFSTVHGPSKASQTSPAPLWFCMRFEICVFLSHQRRCQLYIVNSDATFVEDSVSASVANSKAHVSVDVLTFNAATIFMVKSAPIATFNINFTFVDGSAFCCRPSLCFVWFLAAIHQQKHFFYHVQ